MAISIMIIIDILIPDVVLAQASFFAYKNKEILEVLWLDKFLII